MYWISGLHDACIIGTESFKFPFDYNEFVSEKIIYNRYLITLRINASCYIIKSQTASAIWDFQLSAFAFDKLAVDIKGLDLIIFNSCNCERYGIARL